MTHAAAAVAPHHSARVAWLPALVFLATACATVVAAVASNGSILAGLVPALLVAGIWTLWVAPHRVILLPLLFLALALDKPGDTEGLWQSPVAPLGGLLIANLNKAVDVPALTVSLLIVVLCCLFAVRLLRSVATGTSLEPASAVPASPLIQALAVSFLTAAVLTAYGLARGGDAQMAKIQLQVFVPLLLVAYLLAVSLRGMHDYKALAALVVAAACVKAAMAFWVRLTLPVVFGEGRGQLPYATTHGDSMLFSCAVAILLAAFLEKPARRQARRLFFILPVLLLAIVANNRRLAWVEVAASCALLLALNRRGRVPRAVKRTLILAAPVFLMYAAVGWGSSSRLFKPVAFLRSITDSTADRSTLYRDGENYDLIYTLHENPILGTGFGRPFENIQQLDDISHGFKEWRYLPHNAILGLWAFAGAVGFTGMWLPIVIGVLLAARSYRHARSSEERAAASVVLAAIATYMIHCWGDIGFTETKSIFLVGAGLAIAGQLAVSTGAWRAPLRARRLAPALEP